MSRGDEVRAREVLASVMSAKASTGPDKVRAGSKYVSIPSSTAIRAMLTFAASQPTGEMPGREGPKHGVAWSDDRLGQAYQLIDEAYQEWPSESGPGDALRVAREAVEAADMEIPE